MSWHPIQCSDAIGQCSAAIGQESDGPSSFGRLRWILLIASLYLASTDSAAVAETTWRVGVAREKITPTGPMWMSGYASRDRPSEGSLGDLWAKAVVIEDAAGHRVVLVSMDLVGIDRKTASTIQTGVNQQYGLPRESLVLATSHTHSGPVVGDGLRAMYFLDGSGWQLVRQYTDELTDKTIAAVGRAIDDLRPAKLSWTVGRAHFAVNRRTNAEPDVPALRESDRLLGPVDHDVPILVVQDVNSDSTGSDSNSGAIRLVVFGYACHATTLSGYQWSGDWPGYAQEALERRYPGATAMMWAGCGADQNPIPRREVEHAQRYGAEIDAAVSAAIDRSLIPIQGSIDTQFAEIPLEFASVPDRAQLETTLTSSNRYEVGRARVLLERLEADGQLSKDYPYPVQTWKLGDGPTWLFLGGEVVVDYALRMKGELGAGRTWVASYCNDVMAYIPSLRVLNEGGYEGGDSMVYYGLPSAWDASVEDRVTTEIRRQVALLGGPAIDDALSLQSAEYPDHGDLTVWRDERGNLETIQSPQDWMRRREDVLQSMQSVMGRLPTDDELDALEIRVLSTESFPGYTRQLISYRTIDQAEVTAHLYVPDSEQVPRERSRPAVLALHPTSPLGKLIVAGEGPQANRNYAVELVGRGYVVLAPDYPSFGDLTNDDFHTDRFVSGTMRAIVNHRRAIDVLVARPDVDPQRIGVIGHSLGGHNAIFLGVFDDRVRAVVSSCGWDPFPFYYGGRLGGWASDRYMPRIREVHGNDPKRMPFDFPELIAALAPRAFFSCSPLRDSNFDARGVKEAESKLRDVYRLLDAEENLVVTYPDAEHDFPVATRQAAYEFLDRVLAASIAATKAK